MSAHDPETGLPLPAAAGALDDFRQQILPGLEDSFPEPEPSVEGAAAEMPPEGDAHGESPAPRGAFPWRLALILLGVILAAGAAAVGGVAAWRFIHPRTVVREIVRVEKSPAQASASASGVPVELLPRDLADAWAVASDMAGKIGSDTLVFKRGRAQANGHIYAVQLDFARKGDFTFVKVAGNGLWVVQVDARGVIVRAYPCPRGAKPLRELFR